MRYPSNKKYTIKDLLSDLKHKIITTLLNLLYLIHRRKKHLFIHNFVYEGLNALLTLKFHDCFITKQSWRPRLPES
jgi:hypothetical protein